MLRFYLRLILVLIMIFSTTLLVIHAQPYDDHELRELLLPEGCPAPCFMGIRPGVTTIDEAMKILEASGWVKELSDNRVSMSNISWSWNSRQPQYIDIGQPPSVSFSNSSSNPEVVVGITIPTYLSMGSIMILMGKPLSAIVIPGQLTADDSKATSITLWYANLK